METVTINNKAPYVTPPRINKAPHASAKVVTCVPTFAMSVSDFFSGQTVLVSGATGSVGSVLLEKMLRACPGLSGVFVLLRPKDGVAVEERLKKLFKLPLFCSLPPSTLAKVQAVSGDVTYPDLGLTSEARRHLTHHVTLVFHCAAKVAFTASLRSAITANLVGTRRVLELCRGMQNLRGLVYVSTAYANCPAKEVSERLYPTLREPAEVIRLVEVTPEEELRARTKELLGDHPNTYTFSKQLTEHLLASERGDVRVAIVRPSVVLGTWREPFPGWQDVSNGATGFIAGAGKGVFRTSQAHPHKLADLVPADVVVNFLLAAAWSLGLPGARSLQIYHVTSGTRNPVTWGQYSRFVEAAVREFPCARLAWFPSAKCRGQLWRNKLVARAFQLWPSYLLDLLEELTSTKHNQHKTDSLVSIQQRFIKGMELTHYFSMRQWRFHGDNSLALAKKLSPEDREKFCTTVELVDWRTYIADCVLGIRQHFFRDPPATLSRARRNIARWRLIHTGAHCLLFVAALSLASQLFSSWSAVLGATLTFVLTFLWL